jgi:hypothetical protein
MILSDTLVAVQLVKGCQDVIEYSVVSEGPWDIFGGFSEAKYSAYLWAIKRAGERTRTADLL